jgi:hypothetical protein
MQQAISFGFYRIIPVMVYDADVVPAADSTLLDSRRSSVMGGLPCFCA